MAIFTESELALAVAIDQAVKGLNALVEQADALGLYVSLRIRDPTEEFVGPGEIQRLAFPLGGGTTLEVLVFKAVVVEAAGSDSADSGPADAVLPHGWMG